jgi:hypothetical protein
VRELSRSLARQKRLMVKLGSMRPPSRSRPVATDGDRVISRISILVSRFLSHARQNAAGRVWE